MKRNILKRIRESRFFKVVAVYLAINMIGQILMPGVALALTSGPGQEEFASFEPVTTSDMVDLYSGDFNYNIPLLSVPGPNGGYPINLAYHSGIGMEQEASWVGLGWNVNVGSVTRQLRGLPDDFKEDNIKHVQHLRPSWNVGLNITKFIDQNKSVYREHWGFPPATDITGSAKSVSYQLYYNNYKGLGYRILATGMNLLQTSHFSAGVNFSYDSQSGIGISPNLGLNGIFKIINLGYSASINNREGIASHNFSASYKAETQHFLARRIENYSASLSYNTQKSVPSVSMPMTTNSFPFRVRWGIGKYLGYFYSKAFQNWEGHLSISQVSNGGVTNSKGYGYMYAHENTSEEMGDFQRENIEYSKKVPNLAPSQFTYDVYAQSGQGTGGMFRPYRSDVLALSDRKSVSKSHGHDINLEYGGIPFPNSTPGKYHVGLGYVNQSGKQSSGSWENNGDIGVSLNEVTNTEKDYEPYYFMDYGEMTGELKDKNGDGVDDYYLSQWGGNDALRVKLNKTEEPILKYMNRDFAASTEFIKDALNPYGSLNSNMKYKKSRQRRSKIIQAVKEKDASRYGWNSKNNQARNTSAKDHHISEMVITQADGLKYIYGLPAYNNVHKNVSMSVGNVPVNEQVVNVAENTFENTHNEFLSRSEIDPYVHSWLLTTVVSADYIDVNDNGPDAADYGYWVKFNYRKKTEDYHWRMPYQGANYSEGNFSDEKDNRASYTYGEKELYFLESIETKTHIAVFNTSAREDGLEANDEYFRTDEDKNSDPQKTKRMEKLDKIKLFTLNEYYNADGSLNTEAVPIRTVNFEYDYSLSPIVKNNSEASVDKNGQVTADPGLNVNAKKGKLTLKKLFFTYQQSARGEFSPYVFHYDENIVSANPAYEPRNMDRWGNYKDNTGKYSSTQYYYEYFPYTEQDNNSLSSLPTGQFEPTVAQWTLKKVDLPSGGTLEINYESDDYAYVENKKATRMFDVIGMGTLPDATQFPYRDKASSSVFNATSVDLKETNPLVLYFKMETPVSGLSYEQMSDFVFNNYLRGIDKLWFKTLIDLKGGYFDYVSGYAELDLTNLGTLNYGVVQDPRDASYSIGFVKLKAVDLNKLGKDIHPFHKAALQHLLIERSEIVHNFQPEGTDGAGVANFIGSVFPGPITEVIKTIAGFNYYAYWNGYGKRAYLDGHTIIKLLDPDGKKYGGGVRVKTLKVNDNWVNETEKNSSYGQSYDYTIFEGNKRISSGVAYEPNIGAEESALRSPIEYTESTFLSASRNLHVEKPIMESYYPGAGVGYRKVTVSSIAPDEAIADNPANTLENASAPITIYEFYTPKDFPVIFDETDMNSDPIIRRVLPLPGVYSGFRRKIARSQGYSVILNDMAGKLKSVTQMTRPTETKEGSVISQVKYLYNTASEYNPNGDNALNNEVQVFTEDGVYKTALLGQTYDVFVDMNENRETSKSRGLDLNLEISVPFGALLFMIIPIPISGFADYEMSVKTIVTNKIIHKKGILKEVVNMNNKSLIKTENLAFDLATGSPILTKVTNEFNEPIYGQSFPAHWYYEGMAESYKTVDLTFSSLSMADGEISISSSNIGYFNPGDEVCFTIGSTNHIGHVTEVTSGTSPKIKIIRRDGEYLTGTVSELKIFNPGRKNMLTASVGNIVSKQLNNFSPTGSGTNVSFDQILDASAIEYSNSWKVICNTCNVNPANNNDPYVTGALGLWRPYRSYKYITDRVGDKVKDGGIYADFVKFPWSNPANKDAKWVTANTITMYSPHGFELENMNAIGNHSSAVFGYKSTLPVSVASNAKYNEVAFDGFEDYDSECNDHFNFKLYQENVTGKESHSGRKSIRVSPGTSVEVDKVIGNCGQ